MDNRGTKSVEFGLDKVGHLLGHDDYFTVKAQRLDGKHNQKNIVLSLRYNLINFERNFVFKIHSNSKNKFLFRSYSTSRNNLANQRTDTTNVGPKQIGLSPLFISGFIDAEGSFSVILVKDKNV